MLVMFVEMTMERTLVIEGSYKKNTTSHKNLHNEIFNCYTVL